MFSYTEMELYKIILYARLLPNYKIITVFYNNNLMYLNGFLIKSLITIVFENDFIQFLVTIYFYILLR